MTLHVSLAERSYPIYITPGCLQDSQLFQSLIAERKVCVVSNETVAPLYLAQLEKGLGRKADTVVILPDGEAYKTLATVEMIFDAALSAKLNRSSLIIALGGGVVGDMAGFAAACYQRGIEFIQVPTTLLSQVDSSVGGKTGVNHPLGKNMIGAFHQPKAVFIDINTLETLPPREFAAGLAEVIKYGLIYDGEFFAWLEANIAALNARNSEALSYAIRRSCEIKAEVVAEDETESGIRAILNLGHTFGHAIEANMGYGEWLHGEAIAPGMIMAVDLSVRQGWLSIEVLQRSKALLLAANLPLCAPAELGLTQFLEAMSVDKKNINGAIRLVLLRKLGEAFVCDDYSVELMHKVIEDN